MDNLQYDQYKNERMYDQKGFKPYYKWIIFNIITSFKPEEDKLFVLNLIING